MVLIGSQGGAFDDAPMPPHYPATFRLAGAGMARVDTEGYFTDVNEQFCAMLGYSRDFLIGTTFHDITFVDDRDKNSQLLRRLKAGEIASYRLQKRYVRANGELLWADLFVAPERNPHGELVGLISIITDIGDSKRNEERMDFLLNELSHRSKNVFALVLSIINQTRADGIREFKNAISQRIIGLAASNDLLLGQIGLTTQLAELIDKQLEGFVAPTDPRIGIDVVPVALGANATRVLGMAIHELATNSCKYGALSSLTGRLTISCQVDPQDSDYLMIRWQERGGPILSPPTRSGFGRKVIEVMVSRALDADVQLCFDIEGVRWNCRIHTKNIYL